MPVYVMKAGDLDLYKIGWSANPEKRLKQIRAGSPFTLQIVATLETDRSAELRIHSALRASRGFGEWFQLPSQPTAEDLALWSEPIVLRAEIQEGDLDGLPLLERVVALADRIAAMERELAERRQSRDHLIRTALAEGKSPTVLANAAGLSRQAIYDIRDGKH